MSDVYQLCLFDDCEYVEFGSEELIDTYIEKQREEFRKEWNEYVDYWTDFEQLSFEDLNLI